MSSIYLKRFAYFFGRSEKSNILKGNQKLLENNKLFQSFRKKQNFEDFTNCFWKKIYFSSKNLAFFASRNEKIEYKYLKLYEKAGGSGLWNCDLVATADMSYTNHLHFCNTKSSRHGQFQEKEKNSTAELNILRWIFFRGKIIFALILVQFQRRYFSRVSALQRKLLLILRVAKVYAFQSFLYTRETPWRWWTKL